MNRIGSVCLLIASFMLLPAAAYAVQEPANEARIKVKAAAAIYEPFVYYSKGKLTGFDIDLFNIICMTNNLECETEVVQFSDALSMVSKGSADVALGSIYINSERTKFFNFSDPYFSSGLVRITRAGDAASESGLDNKTIGVKAKATGQAYALKLKDRFPGLRIEVFDSTEESLRALADKKVDIVLNDFLNTQALIHKHYRGILTVKAGLTGPEFLEKNSIALAISKSRPELLNIFNSTLAEMHKGKTLNRLKDKWLLGVEPKTAERIQTTVAFLMACAIGLILFSLHLKRRRINRIIAANEQKYRMLYDANPLPLLIYDINDLDILSANQSAAQFYGSSKEELIGMSLTEFTPSEEIDNLTAKIAMLRDEGNTRDSYSGEWRIKRKDGSVLRFEVASQPIIFEGKSARLAMLIDITERKLAEEKMHDSELRFRTALENAPIPIIILSRKCAVLLANRPARETLVNSKTAPKTFDDLCREAFEDNENTQANIDKLKNTVESITSKSELADVKLQHSDATEHIWNFQFSIIGKWADQDAIMVVATDITEQKRAQEERMHSQRLETIGRLTGGIAHDFNNFLTAILGYSQIALMQTRPDAPMRKNIEAIITAANKSAALTKQLLAFGRKQVMQIQTLNINTTISDLSKIFLPLIRSDIELELELAPDIWSVNADNSQLEQVIMNLVINARDSMPRGGNIIIRTSNRTVDDDFRTKYPGLDHDAYVCIDIRDSGTGMTDEVKARIFDPFFTTKEFGKGTGLGLATAYGIIKQSGGSIYVFSSPGKGSLFRIFLPKSEDMPLIEETKEELHSLPLGTEGLIVVEGQLDVRLYILNILQLLGYKTYEAKDASEALAICQKYGHEISLALIEMDLPKIDGEALAGYMENTYPHIKVVFMSGVSGNISAEHTKIRFITKPFTAARIAQTIRATLDQKPCES